MSLDSVFTSDMTAIFDTYGDFTKPAQHVNADLSVDETINVIFEINARVIQDDMLEINAPRLLCKYADASNIDADFSVFTIAGENYKIHSGPMVQSNGTVEIILTKDNAA
jgi:hypothetical protein